MFKFSVVLDLSFSYVLVLSVLHFWKFAIQHDGHIFGFKKKKKKPQNIDDKWAPGDKAKSNAIIVMIPALD